MFIVTIPQLSVNLDNIIQSIWRHQWVHKDSHKNLMLHCDMAMWMEIIVPEDVCISFKIQ